MSEIIYPKQDDSLIKVSGNILIREIVEIINSEEERLEYELDWNETDEFIVTIRDLTGNIMYHETHSDKAHYYNLKDFIINFNDLIINYDIALDFLNYLREDYHNFHKKFYLSENVRKLREKYVAEKLLNNTKKKLLDQI